MPNNTLVFVKRSLSLSKIFSAMGLFFAGLGVLVIYLLSIFSGYSNIILYLTFFPFLVFGIMMFSTPVLLLYVYDKNNGVLEYLLSLGWNQGDIFKQYLKAALFFALTIFTAEFVAVFIAGALSGSRAVFFLDLSVLLLTAAFGFSVVSLTTTAMMAFSTLQKQRVGANSPLALSIGAVFIVPTFYIPAIGGFGVGFLIDISIALLAAALSVALLILSSRLIRREKMLP